MKKVLSLVLVMAMVLSSMSFAFAAETKFTDMTDNDYAKAVNTLNALGVIDGYEDGSFQPTKTVKRAEMAKLMVELLGYGDLVTEGTKSNFVDCQGHWAEPYIALANGRGLVVGTGDGRFNPEGIVTYDQVYTMVVRGLGYTDACNELKGMTWPTNFKVKASELNITKDVSMATGDADRGGVAQIMYNALESALVSVDTDGNVTTIKENELKNDKQNNKLLLSRIANKKDPYIVTDDKLDPNSKDYAGDKVDLNPYMFQSLVVYVNKNDEDEVVYVKDTNSLVVEGTVDEVTVDGNTTTVAIIQPNGKTEKVKFDTTSGSTIKADLYVNGEIEEGKSLVSNYASLEDVDYITMVDNDKDDSKLVGRNVTGMVIESQTKTGRVESSYIDGKSKVDVFNLPLDNDDKVDLSKVNVTGDASSLEDIKADDVIVEYAALDSDGDVIRTKLVVSRDTVDGVVNRVDGSNIYIDGTKYKLSSTKGSISNIAVNDDGIFYLDHNGKIVDVDTESAGPSNYAVVMASPADGTITTKFDKSIDDYPQLKLATQDDENIVYDVQVKMDKDGKISGAAKVTGLESGTLVMDTLQKNSKNEEILKIQKVQKDDLIKYTLNKDGRISKIEIVARNVNNDSNYETIDTAKAANELSDNVVVFNAADSYNVAKVSQLPSKFDAIVDRDKNGNIKVVVVAGSTIDVAADKIFAYITKIGTAAKNGDEVQAIVTYTDGKKIDFLFTTSSNTVTGDKNKVYSITYDGDDIDDATQIANRNVVTASAVHAKQGTIVIGGVFYSMSEHGTIIGVDKDGAVNDLRDLYDIEEKVTEFEVYYTPKDTDKNGVNGDSRQIDLIVIHEK